MTNYEINEVMVVEIAELLKKYDVFHETLIFYNSKLMTTDIKTQELVVKENVDLQDYTEYGNPDMITMVYKGDNSLYMLVNGYANGEEAAKRSNKIISELIKIGEKYNRWYELGSDINLYFLSNDEDVFTTPEKYCFSTE